MKKRPAVALLIETSNAYARGLLAGIVRYARERHPPWSIRLVEQGRGDPPPAWLRGWRGDGIVARIETQAIARAVKATGLPVIDVSAARHVPGVPWVETDDAAIARLAVEHLRERGFRHFAFLGEPEFNWSKWRCSAFVRALAELGFPCDVFEKPTKSARTPERESLARWIARLPKPVFRASPVELLQPPRRLKDRHLALMFKQNGRAFRAIAWRAVDREDYLIANRSGLELAYSLEQGEYRGEVTTELTVADVRVPLEPRA